MSGTVDLLFEAARAVRPRAYAPYSGYSVGAAVMAADGAIFVGVNVENAAFPSGTCAEAGALAAMVAAGHRRLIAVAVVGAGDALITPCGACRQRLMEFAVPDTLVHVGDEAGIRQSFALEDLLPHGFGPAHLRP